MTLAVQSCAARQTRLRSTGRWTPPVCQAIDRWCQEGKDRSHGSGLCTAGRLHSASALACYLSAIGVL